MFLTIALIPVFLCSADSEIRRPVDTVGYTHTAAGITRVVRHAEAAEKERLETAKYDEQAPFIAAVSPHDDYLYAQRVYVHAFPCLKARHVILIGVAHRARNFPECEGKLVFDAHRAWQGPYGEVTISELREDLLDALPEGDTLVSDEIHAGEHSLEGLVPFLQHYNRSARVVPVLVPYMSWERLQALADVTGRALAGIMKKKGLAPGQDVALLISNDAVHYGDQDWGGKSFADFGTSGAAYDKAVARDLNLIADHLTGEITRTKLEGFYRKVVAEDYHEYRITWCGRFSVPFGLAALASLSDALERPAPEGMLLRYGTTLDPGRSDPGVEGLGVTAKANLHHWVGFTAIGYR
jgi:AmmeMemoRadiSam system protein B